MKSKGRKTEANEICREVQRLSISGSGRAERGCSSRLLKRVSVFPWFMFTHEVVSGEFEERENVSAVLVHTNLES
jgi:hypothetical protein